MGFPQYPEDFPDGLGGKRTKVTFDESGETFTFRIIYGREHDAVTPEFEAQFATKENFNKFLFENPAFNAIFGMMKNECLNVAKKFIREAEENERNVTAQASQAESAESQAAQRLQETET